MADVIQKEDFVYQPLDSTKKEIRLIRLLPESPTEWQTTIECELYHANLDENPSYDALSYVWGAMRKPFKIKVNNRAFAVTVNLFEALIHLRSTAPRALWVDGICIDQGNTTERGEQVSLMRSIYTNAHQVRVWLGHLDLMGPNSGTDFFNVVRKYEQEVAAEFTPRELQSAREGISSILNHPWFTRMWVVQELACSNSAVVHIGDHNVDWSALVALVERGSDVAPRGNTIKLLDRIRKAHVGGSHPALLRLLRDLAKFKTTQHFDRVYALLGICARASPEEVGIVVDYTSSEEDLLIQIARHHVTTQKGIEFLLDADPRLLRCLKHVNKTPGRPSWMPLTVSPSPSCGAALGVASPGPRGRDPVIQQDTLHVQGLIIGDLKPRIERNWVFKGMNLCLALIARLPALVCLQRVEDHFKLITLFHRESNSRWWWGEDGGWIKRANHYLYVTDFDSGTMVNADFNPPVENRNRRFKDGSAIFAKKDLWDLLLKDEGWKLQDILIK